jgi:hypothetical protein
MWGNVGMVLTVTDRISGTKTCSISNVSTVYPTGIGLRMNHRLHGDRPATIILNGGKALFLVLLCCKYFRIHLESCSCDLKQHYLSNVFQTIFHDTHTH